MAGLNDTEFANAMKINYLGPLNDQVYRRHVLLNRLDKNTKDVSGRFAYVPLISSRNPGVGSRRDNYSSSGGTGGVGAKLPAHGRQTYAAATYTMAQHYGRGSVSGTVMRKSRDSDGAFAKALDIEMQGLLATLPDDLNRQVCGMGNGRMGTLSADQGASDVITFEARDTFGMRIGDRVHGADITAGGSFAPTNGTTVDDISFNAATNRHDVTLAATTGASLTAADDAFYQGSGTAMDEEDSSRAQEMYGIRALVHDANIGSLEQIITEAAEMLDGSLSFAGIDRSVAANSFWRSKVDKKSGVLRTLTRTLLFQTHLTVTAQNGANPADIEMYMGPSMWGTLGMIQVGGRVFSDFTETVEMGWSFINVMGSKAFYDRDIHDNEIYFLDMTKIFLLTQGGYEFLDDDGRILRVSEGGTRDAWEFSVHRDVQLGSNNLRSHAVLGDLTSIMTVEGALH